MMHMDNVKGRETEGGMEQLTYRGGKREMDTERGAIDKRWSRGRMTGTEQGKRTEKVEDTRNVEKGDRARGWEQNEVYSGGREG
jgi:hypothetical protein